MPDNVPHKGGKKLGGIDTKWWLIGGGATAILVYVMYSRSKNSAAAAATTTTPTTDPSIDPNTGLPYASEYGNYSAASGVSPSLYGYTDQYGNLISQGTPTQTVTSPTTNAAWFQQAESYLVNSLGYDSATASAALGKYLAGAALTNDQLGIVQTALGAEGNPPSQVPPPHVIPPVGQKPPPVVTPKNPVPKGTWIGTETTTKAIHSAPQIVQHYGISYAVLYALNPWMPIIAHNIPVGTPYLIPTTHRAGTYQYTG